MLSLVLPHVGRHMLLSKARERDLIDRPGAREYGCGRAETREFQRGYATGGRAIGLVFTTLAS
jgi:hypothetical protein